MKYLLVFLVSMVPLLELRGAIPLGATFGLPWWQTFAISVVGNLLPIPFILLLMRWVLSVMKKIKGLRRIALWLEAKVEKKRDKVEKYAFWGLVFFVAVPLPGTGAWTGSLIAALFDLPKRRAFLAVLLGVLGAGVIMCLASYGVVGFLKIFI